MDNHTNHPPSFVKVNGLSFTYEKSPILTDISLTLRPNEIVALIGSSGSGKTTLLKLLSGLLTSHSGSITIRGEPISKSRHHVAFMGQQNLLLPWRTVLGNVTLAAEMTNGLTADLKASAHKLLSDMDMELSADLFPDSLSGGMSQRVALARTLLQGRPLLLLDEPFASLDVLLREHLYEYLRRLRNNSTVCIFLVTHDFRDALLLADRVMCLSKGFLTHEWVIPQSIHSEPTTQGEWQKKLSQAMQSTSSRFGQ